jgi:hypothetical protein
MVTAMKSVQASALALLSAFWMIGTPAAAAAPFDGSWTVKIASNSSACKSGELPIEVRDGKIVSGNPVVNISGQVGQSGGLRVVVGDGVRKANGSGKLAGTSGNGTWSGGGGICSGTWVAERN